MNAACPGDEFRKHDEAVQVCNFAQCVRSTMPKHRMLWFTERVCFR
jgi:hypothetical protein